MPRITRILKNYYHSLWMRISLVVVIIIPFIITFGLVYKSAMLYHHSSLTTLLFSAEWKPMSERFGFMAFIVSSFIVSITAILISAPICILAAIYLTNIAKSSFLKIMHPVIDILAGVPSVIYGVWGIIVIVPLVSFIANFFGYYSSGYSILAGAIVLSVMIIPFVLNILIEIFKHIPVEIKEASLSLGATEWETIKYVLIKKALPGIVSALALGLSRAFGETIAVLMVVGNVVALPKNIFNAGYPLPALIANNYGEMMSIPLYDSALMFAALLLLVIVLFFNVISRIIIMQYEKHT